MASRVISTPLQATANNVNSHFVSPRCILQSSWCLQRWQWNCCASLSRSTSFYFHDSFSFLYDQMHVELPGFCGPPADVLSQWFSLSTAKKRHNLTSHALHVNIMHSGTYLLCHWMEQTHRYSPAGVTLTVSGLTWGLVCPVTPAYSNVLFS